MIEVGYTKVDGTDIIEETVSDAPAANASIETLQAALSGRDDIYTLFLQTSYGGSVHRYAYVDFLEA